MIARINFSSRTAHGFSIRRVEQDSNYKTKIVLWGSPFAPLTDSADHLSGLQAVRERTLASGRTRQIALSPPFRACYVPTSASFIERPSQALGLELLLEARPHELVVTLRSRSVLRMAAFPHNLQQHRQRECIQRRFSALVGPAHVNVGMIDHVLQR